MQLPSIIRDLDNGGTIANGLDRFTIVRPAVLLFAGAVAGLTLDFAVHLDVLSQTWAALSAALVTAVLAALMLVTLTGGRPAHARRARARRSEHMTPRATAPAP